MVEVNTAEQIEVKDSGIAVAYVTNNVEVEKATDLDIRVTKKEYNIVGDDIYIPQLYDDAPQWMKDLVQLTVDVSLESGTTDLVNQLNATLSAFATSYVPLNQYTQSIVSLQDADTVINSLITTLNSTYNDGVSNLSAQVIELQNTKANATEVVAQVISTINSELISPTSNLNATIGNLQQTIANESSARAANFETISSTLEMLDGEISGNATAINSINTYVGIIGGVPDGTGLLADVEILQKQNDGVVETYTGTYDVMLNVQDTNLAELITTATPYSTWIGQESIGGTDVRLAHIGDVYIKYNLAANGTREYIASYKFIKTSVDSTSPYSTDGDGFTWALVVDQVSQDAYQQALNAYDLAEEAKGIADGKISSYYIDTLANTQAMSSTWTDEEKNNNIGDFAVVWNDSTLDNNGTWRWNGISWVNVRDKKLISLASDVTNLSTELSNGTNTWASADSTLENSLQTEISDEGARIESKFAYNSLVNINGVYKKSGFGLTTNYLSGSGTQVDPYVSEFWIDASRFKFTNSNATGSVTPFTIDATGATPQITFNGKVSFSNVTNVPQLGSTPQEVVNAVNSGQTTTIDGGKITTGSITANQIQANSVSADRLLAGTNSATVWTGGGLVSSNFNGNPYGNIGSPTQGFRLSSGAAGTSTDPNIYGAYIKGSTVDIETLSVKAIGYSGNSGRVVKYQKNGWIYMPGYGSGFLASRVCSQAESAVKVEGWYRAATNYLVAYLQYSTDGVNWANLAVKDAQQYGYQEYFYIYFAELFNPNLVVSTAPVTFRIIGSVSGNASDILISIYNN